MAENQKWVTVFLPGARGIVVDAGYSVRVITTGEPIGERYARILILAHVLSLDCWVDGQLVEERVYGSAAWRLKPISRRIGAIHARGLVAAGCRRAEAGLGPARLVARDRRCHQSRIDIAKLALRCSIERGDAAWLASVEQAFVALSGVPYRHPDDPQSHNEVWIACYCVSPPRWSMPAVRSGCLVRDVLHEQSERYRRLSVRRETGTIRDVEAEHAAIVHAVLRR